MSHELVALESIGHRREATQVGIKDHRADDLQRAAADLPVKNASARLRSDVGLEQVDGGIVAEPGLERQREPPDQMPEDRNLVLGEAAGARGRPRGGHTALAVRDAVDAKADDLGEVVGRPLLAEAFDQRERDRLAGLEAKTQARMPSSSMYRKGFFRKSSEGVMR